MTVVILPRRTPSSGKKRCSKAVLTSDPLNRGFCSKAVLKRDRYFDASQRFAQKRCSKAIDISTLHSVLLKSGAQKRVFAQKRCSKAVLKKRVFAQKRCSKAVLKSGFLLKSGAQKR
jgi:hypothetical protein